MSINDTNLTDSLLIWPNGDDFLPVQLFIAAHDQSAKSERLMPHVPFPVLIIIAILLCMVVFVIGLLVKQHWHNTNSDKNLRKVQLDIRDSKIALVNSEFVDALNYEDIFAMKFSELEEICNHLSNADDLYLSRFIQNHQLGNKRSLESFVKQDSKVLIVEGSRFLALPCTRKSMVNCDIHVNMLFDLTNKPIFVASVPMANCMEKFMDFIVDQQIGTIVFVGKIRSILSEVLAFGYIPSKTGVELSYGKWMLKTTCFDHNDFCNLITLEAHLQPAHGRHPIVIKVLSVPGWPFIVGHTNQQMCAQLAQIPLMIENLSSSKRCQQQPAILFQCKTGVHLAPAVLAVYLSWQLYKCKRLINVIAVLKYIQQYRFGAFCITPLCSDQLPVIFSVVKTMITEIRKFDNTNTETA